MKIKHDDVEVNLDSSLMKFNETNLSDYLMNEASHYAYIAQKLAEMEHVLQKVENQYEAAYSTKFVVWKEEGGSDKLVEAKCKSDPELIALKGKIAEVEESVMAIRLHLKAWDKCHENAQSLGHNLRKEMEKLGTDIRFRGDPELEKNLEEAMRKNKDS